MSRPFSIQQYDDESQIRNLRSNMDIIWTDINKMKSSLNELLFFYDEDIKISDLKKSIGISVKEFISTSQTDVTMLPTDEILLMDASLSSRNVTLPAITAVNLYNRYVVKKTDTSVNTVTLLGSIDGGNYVLHHPYESVEFVAGQGGYYITSHYIGSGVELTNDPDSIYS